jgi:hypothetical protein
MKFPKTFLISAFVLHAALVSAQNPVSVLSAGDVDKFIKTAKPMNTDLEGLGFDTSGESGDELLEAMQTNAQVIAVIKKHGWEPNTISAKWMAISLCYAKLKMDEQLSMMPADQQQMMKEMMKNSGQDLDAMINAEDLKLVKAKLAQLDALMTGE